MQLPTRFLTFKAFVILILIFGLLLPVSFGQALTNPKKFPRLGNYFLRGGNDLAPETIPLLARYDLLVLPAEVQITNPDLFQSLRKKNPNIILLAYVASTSYAGIWNDSLHAQLLSGIRDDWWLRDQNGNQLSIWPQTQALNLASDFAPYLADFTYKQIWKTNLWDGIFFDEVGECIVCEGLRTTPFQVDLNHDGKEDAGRVADNAWQNGTVKLLQGFRQKAGPRAIIITNGSSNPAYQPFVNGRMFESFPTPWEADGSWTKVMQSYDTVIRTVGSTPPVVFLDGDTENTGIETDFQDVRFGLTSTLLQNGYFGYSWGLAGHGQTWWYDEYDVSLGSPTSKAMAVKQPKNTDFSPDVWRREFENGLVLVNSTSEPQSISLGGDFEKIHGNQDSVVNDGSITSQVQIPSQDGLIMLRLSEEILNSAYPNGGFTRILKSNGQTARTGFFLYDPNAEGSEEILKTDLDHNGSVEILVASQGQVIIWPTDENSLISFAPYGKNYHGAINLAVGNTDGQGSLEIITGAGNGGGPHIRIFGSNGQPLSPGFFAFDPQTRQGVTVAAGDVDEDGKDEIIAGSGAKSKPMVKIFQVNGEVLNQGFYAYNQSFAGGVNVAAGDVNGDGKDEIITGAGRGGGPHVRVFNELGKPLNNGFFPYDSKRRDGVRVGASDIDNDGKDEILAITNDILP